MSKFWSVVFIITFIGIAGILLASASQEIHFTDLETECRFDRGQSVNVDVTNDNELEFEGYFPVQTTQSDMKYTYEHKNNRIVLNILAENEFEPEDFERTCYAVGVYEASTQPIEGQKWVAVKHQGDQVYKSRINFK